MCNTSLWNFFFVSRLYLYLRVEKLKNRKERDRTVDRLSNEYLSSRFGKQASTIAVTEYRSGSIEFSRKRLAFSRGNCANVIILKFPSSRSSFITFGSVFILRNEPRPAPFVTDRTRSIRASAFRGRSAGARTSLEERLIIIRRSSIEQCLDGPASLSRCDPRSSIAAETT